MNVLQLTAEDWARFRRIRMNALAEAPEAYGSTLEDASARSETDWRSQLDTLATFVAVIDGEDAGTARGGPHDTDPAAAFLLSMWVAPDHRGCGVGERLIDAVAQWARSAGYSRLLLDVADRNLPAIALYRRAGFLPTGETGSLPPPRSHIREHRLALTL